MIYRISKIVIFFVIVMSASASYINVTGYEYSIDMCASIHDAETREEITESFSTIISGDGVGSGFMHAIELINDYGCDEGRTLTGIGPFFLHTESYAFAAGAGVSDITASWTFTVPTELLTIDFFSTTSADAEWGCGHTTGTTGWTLLDETLSTVIENGDYTHNSDCPYSEGVIRHFSESKTWDGLLPDHVYKLQLNSYSAGFDNGEVYRSIGAMVSAAQVPEPSCTVMVTMAFLPLFFGLFFKKEKR